MRIVQIITGSTSFGGAEAHVRDLSVGLRERGHECIVMVGPPEGLFAEQLRAKSVPVILIPALRKPIRPIADTVCLLQLIRALRKARPDVIATHTSKAGFLGRLAARAVGAPCFFTPHGLSFINRQSGDLIPYRLLLERMAARLGGGVIAVCEAERKLALSYLADTGVSVSTIHNGLPDCELRSRGGCDQRPLVITMIARFDRQKDHATLIRALSLLKHLEWELRLAGTGPLIDSARQLSVECGLEDRIRFLLQCNDTPRLLAESDIYALISNFEAFPISILEAMRAGLPVIATETGGVGEAVEDQLNGFTVGRRDINRVAERLASLLLFDETRRVMGTRSRQRFDQMFEWQHMLDKTEQLYTKALGNEELERYSAAKTA